MASAIIEFLEALNRLVERGVKPTLDAVAIEAGRKKGSIRRGLDRHKELVTAIAKAAELFEKEAENSNEFKLAARIEKLKKERDLYLAQYNSLLSEHIGLIYQLEDMRIENLELREKLGEQIAKKKAAGTLVSILK